MIRGRSLESFKSKKTKVLRRNWNNMDRLAMLRRARDPGWVAARTLEAEAARQ